MSRIDEALRRSGVTRPTRKVRAVQPDEVFSSPWEFDENDARHAEPVTAPAVAAASAPAASAPAIVRDVQPRAAFVSTPERIGFRDEWKERLMSAAGDPALGEQFKRLAAALLHGQKQGRLKLLMVTSAIPGEGKSMTALNLALVLSESYHRRVLIIDADLRHPGVSGAANVQVERGLSEALRAPQEQQVPLVQLGERLTLLPAGRPDPDPLSGLTSERMQRILEEAAEQFDWVIVDTPPVDAAADAGLLCPMLDACLFVVRARQTPHEAVQRAVESIGQERIFGVVLNGVDAEALERRPEYSRYQTGVVG
jgi:capsular exopolysaccharide synthesis family protein